MRDLDIIAVQDNLPEVLTFVGLELSRYDCSRKILTEIYVAVEEIFINIASYAYELQEGPATIRTEVCGDPLSVVISFIDNGMQYDPLAKPDPDLKIPVKERRRGGLGIFMVKKTMDDVSYEYKEGQNILTIKKQIG